MRASSPQRGWPTAKGLADGKNEDAGESGCLCKGALLPVATDDASIAFEWCDAFLDGWQFPSLLRPASRRRDDGAELAVPRPSGRSLRILERSLTC